MSPSGTDAGPGTEDGGAGADAGPDDPNELVWRPRRRRGSAQHRGRSGVRTRDIQDTWVSMRVTDARGRVIGEAGTDHAEGPKDDPTAFRLRSAPVDDEGRFDELHRVNRFRATVFDNTVPPRDASVVRYALELPDELDDAALPLRVETRLRHRRHSRAMHDAACESSRSERGRAFAAAARKMGRPVLDGSFSPAAQLQRERDINFAEDVVC